MQPHSHLVVTSSRNNKQKRTAMKKFAFLLVIIMLGLPVVAQDEENTSTKQDEFKTIFQRENGEINVSGFGGPMMSFSSIGDNFAHMMGGGGGVIVNNYFFGGYGMGLTTSMDYKGSVPSDEVVLDYGHGGFWVGYIIAPRKPVHLSVSGQFGWGSISETNSNATETDPPISSEPIFVISPIAELELNFSHFFKVGIGSSVSYVRGRGITQTNYTMSDFLKPSVFLSFKFGWYE